jgi:hypothetical protein
VSLYFLSSASFWRSCSLFTQIERMAGQVDGNDGEVEFECDNDDDFAEPAGDNFDVDDSEERVVADNAHDHGAGTKGEDG